MKKSILRGTLLMAVVAALNVSFTCRRNITIYHQVGNGNYVVLTVRADTKNVHAAHGDLWYSTLCPLSGSETACR